MGEPGAELGARMRVSGWVLLAAMLALPWRGAAAEPARLLLTTEEDPPYNFTDPVTGRITGIAGELVPLIMERAGIAYDVQMLPWRRAYEMAQRQANTCVFAINVTRERLPLFEWVGPVAHGGWTLFGRPDWNRSVTDLATLGDVTVVVQSGSGIEAHLVERGVAVVPVTAMGAMMPMLANRRADLVAIGAANGPWLARQAGIELKPVLRMTDTDLSVACNPGLDKGLLARMRAALKALRDEGTVERLNGAYR